MVHPVAFGNDDHRYAGAGHHIACMCAEELLEACSSVCAHAYQIDIGMKAAIIQQGRLCNSPFDDLAFIMPVLYLQVCVHICYHLFQPAFASCLFSGNKFAVLFIVPPGEPGDVQYVGEQQFYFLLSGPLYGEAHARVCVPAEVCGHQYLFHIIGIWLKLIPGSPELYDFCQVKV